MDKSTIQLILLVVASIGLLASILGYMEYTGRIGVCSREGIFDCSIVYRIPGSRLPLGIHLSEAAPIYFTILGGAVLYWVHSGSRRALWASLIVLLAGASLIPYLLYLEVWVAGALCLYCTVMHLSIVSGLVIVFYTLRAGDASLEA